MFLQVSGGVARSWPGRLAAGQPGVQDFVELQVCPSLFFPYGAPVDESLPTHTHTHTKLLVHTLFLTVNK